MIAPAADIPPALMELIRLLPAPTGDWPAAERMRWLRAFEAVCCVVYEDALPPLSITLAQEPAP